MILKYNEDYFVSVASFVYEKYEPHLSQYGFNVSCERIGELVDKCADDIFIIEDRGIQGVIAGMLYSPFVETTTMMMIIAWVVEQSYRRYSLQLYKTFENHCRAKGIEKLSISSLHTDLARGSRLYGRMGYRPTEMQYIKEL